VAGDQEMGAEPVTSVAGLFEHQYVSLHVPLTEETKASINKAGCGFWGSSITTWPKLRKDL